MSGQLGETAMEMEEHITVFAKALDSNSESYGLKLSANQTARLVDYYKLLKKWNPRLHLVAPCTPEEFATRHVLESLLLLPHLPAGADVADIGSGAGLPIIPCLITRSDIRATLIEASPKKSVFLREALNQIHTSAPATVIVERFEHLAAPSVRFVTCRALERFEENLQRLVDWAPRSTLLLFSGGRLREKIEAQHLPYSAIQIPNSKRRFLFVIRPA